MLDAKQAKKPSLPIKMRIRKGDTVQVINGKEKGKTGSILSIFPKKNRAIVKGVNMAKKHQKPSQNINNHKQTHKTKHQTPLKQHTTHTKTSKTINITSNTIKHNKTNR